MSGRIRCIDVVSFANKPTRVLVFHRDDRVKVYQSDLALSRVENLIKAVVGGKAPGLSMKVLVLSRSIVVNLWRV